MNPMPKIIYEDDDILVIDKPAGLVVHEGAGKEEWTVKKWSKSEIVHRLDKDTSGLMVLTKSKEAAENLKNQFAQRQVRKEYTTLVLGKVEPKRGEISGKIGRSSKNRQKMAVLYLGQGREARTGYEVIQQYRHPCESRDPGNNILDSRLRGNDRCTLSLLKVFPKTGRTHQIRVHLKHFGYPVIGDQKYFTKISRKISKELELNRQFLHASRLEFKHPRTGERVEFKSDLPKKLNLLLTLFS